MSDKKEIISGVLWNSVSKYSGILISIIISAILARLVSPEEFGIIAIATVFVNFISMFTDMGIGAAVVQNNTLTSYDYDNFFTISLYLGILLTAISFLISSYYAQLYNNLELEPIIKILSISLFFNCLNILPNSLMLKGKRFKQIAIRTLSFQIAGGLIGIGMALNNYGAYSRIVPPIISNIGMFFYNFYYYPRKYLFKININSIRKIYSFSIYQFLFSCINFFSRNTDKLIIGKYMDIKSLGYYEKSYRLMLLPLENISNVITPVIVPVLSHLQDQHRELARKQEKMARYISMIGFPLGIFLFYTSYEIISIYYGKNWVDAVPVFRILSLSIPLQLILSTTGSYYQCAGKTKHMFYNGIINTLCTISGFIIAAKKWGTIEAVAYSWDITLIINFFISYFIMYKITLKCDIKELYMAIYKSFINSLISFVILYLFTIILDTFTPSIWVSFILKTIVWGIITLVLLHLTKQCNIITLYKYAIGKLYNLRNK